MVKKVTIRDYAENKKEIEIKDFENVLTIRCDIKSGDEILIVTYEDLHEDCFDSSDDRWISYDDGSSYIYIKDKLDLLDKFSKKKSSYDDIE